MKWRLAAATIALGLIVGQGAGTARAESDTAQGQKVFNKCKACHSVQAGKNRVGPSLAGIVGRPAGTAEGYNYSDAMKNSGITWDEESLDKFLTKPKDMVPGTKMTFGGIKKEDDRKALIKYLEKEAM